MSNIIALDVGTSRIGIAMAHSVARLPSPHKTIQNHENVIEELAELIRNESVEIVVVGLPRNLSGQDTEQTKYCREFGQKLSKYSKIEFQDEALTSQKAEAELRARGRPYNKGDIDALAATFILEDYLNMPNRSA